MSGKLRYSEQPHHLISLFRQATDSGEGERREMVRDMLEIALQRISGRVPLLPAVTLHLSQEADDEIQWAVFSANSDPTMSSPERAAGLVASLAARMLRASTPCDPLSFAHIAVAWGDMDATTKFRDGRRPATKAAYFDALVRRHPAADAKTLLQIANAVGIDQWPFRASPADGTFYNQVSKARQRVTKIHG